ncbi:O-antigen ligase family protein [uncultured Draconibacterium sp.]|uniref:O-antigen ligase family protein n=1 Tax=uncultured Draconibacterium sp. TaxID=1573823 RepID=UPI0025D56D59|nr:O-antigen ligase family protein [uncultured Draconibacterium sp.]
MTNSFTRKYGAEILRKPQFAAVLIAVVLGLGYVTAHGGMVSGIGIIILPFIISYIYLVFMVPKAGLVGMYILNFTAIGIGRYVKGVPMGLTIDAHFILIYASLFFMAFFRKIPWSNAKNDLTLLAVVWYAYALFQLVNPEAVSRVAWFYAMRGVSLYMLFAIPVLFILFNKNKDLDMFLKLWAVFSVFAVLKGLMQKFIGVDPFEQAWLDEGNDSTHLLFGKLRVFSYYSDAGQFGAAMGHTGVVFSILGWHEKKSFKLKVFYLVVGFLGLYGMMISGTRGAIAVPIVGGALYFVLKKNIKILALGLVMGVAVLVFFKYTSIGSGNYTIQRMRTAFDPNDASLQVRLANQRKLKTYLASRPFGGGIGSAGGWGLRFSPHTFLAQTATDSWYVMIWAEQGVIGLVLHLCILFYIVGKGAYVIMFKLKDEEIKAKMSALVCGIFGIMGASYGNGVLGQMPTGILIYSSMAFLFMAQKLDKEQTELNALNDKN